MATRQIGLGTVVDFDENSVTLMVDVTPPARTRTTVDQTAIDEELATYAPGIEEHSEFSFTQFWHPTDAAHAALDALFDSKEEVDFIIKYPFALEVTDTFTGVVSALEPETITRDGVITRKVTVQRMSDTTREEEEVT
jgi:hypothetical protein